MAVKKILKRNFIDPNRVAVHGWSGGPAVPLNFMFQYPKIHKTEVAIAAVTDQHFYDNIYTEHYMGLSAENEAASVHASPVSPTKNSEIKFALYWY